jgi:DNA gyrase subunit A
VIRTSAAEVKISGRQTMGVRLMNLAPGDSVVAVARNAEAGPESEEEAEEAADPEAGPGPTTDMDTSPEAGQETGEEPEDPEEGEASAPRDAT